MREFQNKRHMKNLVYSRYTLVALFILIVILGNAVWNSYNKYEKSSQADQEAKQELAALQKRSDDLNRSIASLNTQEGKEREIRERFGLLKEGEKMVVFVDTTSSTSKAANPGSHWWDWIANMFR